MCRSAGPGRALTGSMRGGSLIRPGRYSSATPVMMMHVWIALIRPVEISLGSPLVVESCYGPPMIPGGGSTAGVASVPEVPNVAGAASTALVAASAPEAVAAPRTRPPPEEFMPWEALLDTSAAWEALSAEEEAPSAAALICSAGAPSLDSCTAVSVDVAAPLVCLPAANAPRAARFVLVTTCSALAEGAASAASKAASIVGSTVA